MATPAAAWALGIAGLGLGACTNEAPTPPPAPVAEAIAVPAPPADPPCPPGTRVLIAAVGDVMVHERVQRAAYRDPEGFVALFGPLAPALGQADLAYGNLETPTAPRLDAEGKRRRDPGRRYDGRVYSDFPRFNAAPELVEALATVGVDVISTANNHALDRGPRGLALTLDAATKAGLRATGTRVDAAAPFHVVTRAGGLTLAWLACTLHTNWEIDRRDQVLHCFDDPERVPTLVAELARSPGIDAVIVTPHWGDEYSPTPTELQRGFARRVLEAGATAVLGSHPHVLQPIERHVTADGRATAIVHSLGNLISAMKSLPRRSAAVVYVGLRRHDGRTEVEHVHYRPFATDPGDTPVVRPVDGANDPEAFEHVVGVLGEAGLWTEASAPPPDHCQRATSMPE